MGATSKVLSDKGQAKPTADLEVWIDETERRTWFLSAVVGEQRPR